MDCPRVCVVDNSASVRETIAIVLGDAYNVRGLSADDYLGGPLTRGDADLLIVGDDLFSPHTAGPLADGPPVLWLQSGTVPPLVTTGVYNAIPRWFSPEDLRAQVQALLTRRPPPQPALSVPSIITYPIFPRAVADLAKRAADTHFPVLICGETGTGRTRLARAIHTLGREGRFVALSAAGCTRTALQQAASIAPGKLTVFVSDVSGLPADAQRLVIELLDTGGLPSDLGWHEVRLIGATSQSLEGLARTASLDKELFYRLSVLPITLLPLRERRQDIPALANHLVVQLAHQLSTEVVVFTERALHRLANYLWFGNLAEFETVLTRTVALTPDRTIDAEDLLFGYNSVVPRRRHESSARPRPQGTESTADEVVDLIVNELAHEFKNPMVTIKTVAQHLEHLLADEAGREDVARLTGEAVDRMDRTLENLLQFTRFRRPAAQAVPVVTLLAPCLTDLTSQLSERRVSLSYRPPEPFSVFVDAAQIGYAFENLLRAITRDLAEGDTLAIHAMQAPAAVTFEFPALGHPIGGKLSRLLDHPPNGAQPVLPLGLVFAKALIERNGGRMEIRSLTDTTAITVWLPTHQDTAAENGKATSPHS